MNVKALLPRRGNGTLRLDDSDDLVVIENVGVLPESGSLPEHGVYIENHAVIVICTEGMAQFQYDGQTIQLRKNDMFIYMMLKVTLSEHNAAMLDDYFQLLCRRMRDRSPMRYHDIVRSLFSTMLLEILGMIPHDDVQGVELESQEGISPAYCRKRLADKFMQLVEQSDGRVRKVDDFARQLNVTPKYLSVLLKETMNRRPSVVIQLFTLKAIERRLRFTDMTMLEIANDLNFANASFFGKYVKEHLGMSPLEYRKKYQQ